MQTTTRTALFVLAALLGGCSADRTLVAPSEARPRYDGVHTLGSGNQTVSTAETDTTTVSASGVHTFGSGN